MSADLLQLIQSAYVARPKIGVIGDLMYDEYVWGEVERISPEAPIPVIRVSRRHYRAGGAGSVVVDLCRLGAQVSVFSLLGRDAAGEKVAELFDKEGCELGGLVYDEGHKTTVKTRCLGYVQQANRAVQQILRVDDEDLRPISDEIVGRLVERIADRIGELDAVLISDYNKGLVGDTLVRRVVELAGDTPVLVDPARLTDYSRYRGVSLICPNRFEAELASEIGCRELSECQEAGAKLIDEYDIDTVAMTLDREGILLCRKDRSPEHVPTRARVVADVTGAGDMVLAVLGWVIAGGGSVERACALANIAAGFVVRRVGVSPVSREELTQEIRYHGHPGVGKIKGAAELSEAVRREQESGKAVVFTNGCFDLLHPGHHHLLNGARQEGDLLVVAINSDASIRRLKGPDRPRIPQEDRIAMIAGLESVDYVTVFEEDTPNHLLESLKPQVLVKGGEYEEGVVVGREIVEAYGGRIAFVEQIPGISTTILLGDDPQAG